jgi:hypothetical protein
LKTGQPNEIIHVLLDSYRDNGALRRGCKQEGKKGQIEGDTGVSKDKQPVGVEIEK